MGSKTIYGTCYDNDSGVTQRYLFYAEVKAGEQNVDENYTPVTVALKVCRNPEYPYASSAYNLTDEVTVKLSIDGSEVYSTTTADIDTRNAKIWTFTTKTKNVPHAADGTKTVAITASFSGADVSSLNKGTLSGSVELDTIPRASSITSAGAVTLGNKCSVKWTPASTDFYYKLQFSLGDWGYTTGIIHPNQTSAYIYTGYAIPLAVAKQITKAKTGTMTAKLYTYSDSDGKTPVGDADSATFTVTVPSNRDTQPTVSMTLSPVSDLDDAFAGLYIQGKTKVKGTLSATGKYGASIVTYYIMDAYGAAYTSEIGYTTGYLPMSGKTYIAGWAVDSRGIIGKVEMYVDVIAYSNPKIQPAAGESSVVAARCDAAGNLNDSGNYLKIKAKRSYSLAEADGEQKNFCKIQYRYKVEGGEYSDWYTILASSSLTSDEVTTGALLGGALAVDKNYLVQVQAIDDTGEYSRTTIAVPSEEVYWHRDGARRSFSFGEYVEEDNTFAIAKDIAFKVKGGGNIDVLTLGKKLVATADSLLSLDDLKTPGNYYSPNAETSLYITESPRGNAGGFGLRVREIQTSSYIRQEQFYGRTTWVRHWDGTEWSDWLRYLTTTVDETPVADYVIETGESGGWTYKKWKGGTYELFGTFEVTPPASTLRDTLYRTDNMIIALPFAIASAIVTGTAVGYYWITNGGKSGDSAITLRLMGTREFDTTTAIEVRLMVVGTYA